jgi:hypothetical protein
MEWFQNHIAELAMSAAMAWGRGASGRFAKQNSEGEAASSESTN